MTESPLRPRQTSPRWPSVMLGGPCAFEAPPPWMGQVALGNGSQFEVTLVERPDGYLLVAVTDHGVYPFQGFAHHSYAAEKLNLRRSDAANLADFINTQIADPRDLNYPMAGHEQGTYQKQFCQLDEMPAEEPRP